MGAELVKVDCTLKLAPGAEPTPARRAAGALPFSGVPHSPQKTSPWSNAAPHDGQATSSGVAQATQNFRPGLFSVAQLGQITGAAPTVLEGLPQAVDRT
jgi:hypothetical protein